MVQYSNLAIIYLYTMFIDNLFYKEMKNVKVNENKVVLDALSTSIWLITLYAHQLFLVYTLYAHTTTLIIQTHTHPHTVM